MAATTNKTYISTHPGQIGSKKIETMIVPPEDGASGYLHAFLVGQLFNQNTFPVIGGGFPYTAGQWTVVTGGTSDAQAEASSVGGGLLLTLASDDNFDTTLTSVQTFTPASGDIVACRVRLILSDADGAGVKIGFTTGGAAAALPFGTNYTDAIVLTKAITDEEVLGQVRGNAGTAADTGTLVTAADATEFDLGFWCRIGAAGVAAGAWWDGSEEVAFTAAQLAAVATLLTTPQAMYFTIHGTGVTATTPTITVVSALAGLIR